jgi:hypothetical protein
MKKTSRRGFGKQLGLAIGAIPIVSLTTKTVEAKPRKFEGDTPITVGGGGGTRARRPLTSPFGDIMFKHDDYILDGDTYGNPLIELTSVQIRSTNYAVSANTRVDIQYTRGVTSDNHIIINKDGNMGVTFVQNYFPYDVMNKKHHGDVEITRLMIGATEKPLPANGYFEIKAHTRLKNRRRKNRS